MTRRLAPADPCELIDGGAAGGEVRHHLGGHLGRIGRDALRRHPVISREHENLDAIEPWWDSPLPLSKPRDRVLQSAETAGRLGQLRFALRGCKAGGRICGRQIDTGRPQVGERRETGHAGLRCSECRRLYLSV